MNDEKKFKLKLWHCWVLSLAIYFAYLIYLYNTTPIDEYIMGAMFGKFFKFSGIIFLGLIFIKMIYEKFNH